MGSIRLTAMSFGFAGVLLAAGTARAGLSYVSQDRRVEAAAGDELPPRFPGTGEVRGLAADGFGPFDAAERVEYVQSHDLDYQEARASQMSRLGPTGLSAAGEFRAFSQDELVRHHSRFAVTFDVSAATPYRLSATIPSLGQDPYPFAKYIPFMRYVLEFRQVGPQRTEPLVEVRSSSVFDLYGSDALPVDARGTLLPGRYELVLDIDGTFNGGAQAGAYSLDLVTGLDAGPTPAVPLPPAVWAGLPMLTLVAVGARRTSRTKRKDIC